MESPVIGELISPTDPALAWKSINTARLKQVREAAEGGRRPGGNRICHQGTEWEVERDSLFEVADIINCPLVAPPNAER
jgi:hypothetical protein